MKKSTEKLFYILIPLLFAFPLFKESIVTFIFLLLTVNTFCYCISNKSYPIGLKQILPFTIPFWIVLINCLLFMKNIPDDLAPIKRAALFLFFPIVFFSIPKIHFTREKITFYLEIFKNVCLIMAFGYILGFLYKYDFSDFFVFKYGIPKFRDYVYYEIDFFKIHPTYYTTMLMLCCAYCFDKVLREKKYLELLYIFAFVLITFLLLVKINMIFLIVLLLGMVLFRSPLSNRQKIGSATMVLVAITAIALSVPGFKKRFVEVYENYDKPPVGLAYSTTNVRVSIYACCWKIAKTDGLLGVGFPHLGDQLLGCYKENYDSSFYAKKGYLSHNYFFYIFLSSGVIGIMLFLLYVYKVVKVAFKVNTFLFSIGLINILVICFVEDYLYRQYGLFYFSLLFFTFYNNWRQSKLVALA